MPIDRWDDATGANLYEHLAGVNDLLLAMATFEAAVKRWLGAKITLRNGALQALLGHKKKSNTPFGAPSWHRIGLRNFWR
jgi:hypothetical protein